MIEDPDTNPHRYGYLIFNEGAQNMLEKRASSTNGAGKTGHLPVDQNLFQSLTPH
jgi:hypothetical protein